MNTSVDFLGIRKAVVGMIHVDALPGTPRGKRSMAEIVRNAVEEARVYREAGLDALAIENMHDIPYMKGAVGPEITAAMAVIGREVKAASGLPCGIQILAGANREALAAALAGGLDFIRAEGYVFAHVADEGIIEGCAGDLLRYRKSIGATHVKILADVKKKHAAHAITSDVGIVETARAAQFFDADGVIVTGLSTGHTADAEEIRAVKAAVAIPVLVGSGVTELNVEQYFHADALIVGTNFKKDGCWENPVDKQRAAVFMHAVERLRGRHA